MPYCGLLRFYPAEMKRIIVFALLYGLIKFGQTQYHLPEFFHHYATDLLCMPLVLSMVDVILSHLNKSFTTLNAWQIIFAIVYCSLLFEFILPHYSASYTADWRDTICYSIGGIIYYALIRLSGRMNQPTAPKQGQKPRNNEDHQHLPL